MDVSQLDVVVRISAATVILVLAVSLARASIDQPGARTAAWLFAPLAICLSGFLSGNTPDADLRLSGLIGATAHVFSGWTAVFLWWFCLACFDRDRPLSGLPLVLGIAWFLIALVDRGLLGFALAQVGLSWLLVAMGFVIVGHLIWRLLKDRSGDLIHHRRGARIMVVVLLGGQLLADLIADVVMGFGWRPRAFALAQNLSILVFGLWLSSQLSSLDVGMLTFGARKATSTPSPVPCPVGATVPARKIDAELSRRLSVLLEIDRVHLKPGIDFAEFVRRMGAPERTVRDFINRQLGHDYFRAFLNHHRLAEARRLLADPARSTDKIISISLDSGFASLPSFNRAFHAAEGCSPTRFRERERNPRGSMTDSEKRSAVF